MPTRPGGHAATFAKVIVLPALTFLLVPLLTVGFCWYGQHRIDGMILGGITRSIDADPKLDAPRRAETRAFFEAHPASRVCAEQDPALARYRAAVCKPWGETWQFTQALRLGWLSALVGGLAFLAIGALGLLAYLSRRAQHWTFMLGWRLLVATTVAETLVQGVLLVWLSYWGTALLLERYFPKLILVAAVLAGVAALAIVRALLREVPLPAPLEAERLKPADAPALWSRVKDLAARLGTRPPLVIAAGIDDNFFVTESPMPLTDGTPGASRLLYVSLPLLRTLSAAEADAVLGHELAHFKGGDTAASARLWPALVRYDAYAATLAEGGLTRPAFCVLRLYRAVFELALKREQRRRELAADAEAARLTSPDDLGRSLLKISGYSDFRAHTERALFEQREAHRGELSLSGRIAEGLPAYAASQAFQAQVAALRVPHPFDSHPPLQDRLAHVAAAVQVGDAGRLLQAPPADSWADAILTASAIEGRLWAAYEARFKTSHEESLAWRYLPATDEERALVLRFFPDLAFPLKGGGTIQLTHRALTAADGQVAPLSAIAQARIVNGTFTSALVLELAAGEGRARTLKVKLRPLGAQQARFKAAFAHYWKRDQVARRSR